MGHSFHDRSNCTYIIWKTKITEMFLDSLRPRWYKYLTIFFHKFSPNLLNERIDEDRARRKQSL